MMRSSTLAAVGGTTLGVAGLATAALMARKFSQGLPDKVMLREAGKLLYEPMVTGVSRATAYGDPEHGAHGVFTRFLPGTRLPVHTHASDIHLVVLAGAYLFGEGDRITRVPANSYFFLPAGVPHWSGGDELEGALFFEQSPGKFTLDLID